MERRLGNVVVGTDFQPHSDEALARAMWLPVGEGCSVTIVHALVPMVAPIDSRLDAAARALLENGRKLALAEAARAGLRDVDVFTALDAGRAVEVLAERARDGRAEVLVVGRGERRGVGERFLGSIAERVVRIAPCNALVVGSPPEGPYRRAVVGVAATDAAKRVIDEALRLVPRDAITLVHAFNAPFADMTPDILAPPMTPGEVRAYLADAEKAARAELRRHTDVEPLLVRGDPRRVLLQQAVERRADLVVIGHHERTLLGRRILGSVATAAVRGAPCDVLVVR
jgi:nucleotide-binding universal stress UspA family protein